MAIQNFQAVLPLSIDSFMELFPDNRTLSLCLIEMSTYIRNYYCERLNSIPEIGWTIDSGARTG